MLSASTITNAQIEDLRSTMLDRIARGVDTRQDRLALLECEYALGNVLMNDIGRVQRLREARQRCAEIVNARSQPRTADTLSDQDIQELYADGQLDAAEMMIAKSISDYRSRHESDAQHERRMAARAELRARLADLLNTRLRK